MSFGGFFSTLNPTLMTYSFNTTNTYKTMHEVITYSLMQSQKSNLQIYFNKFIKTISNPFNQFNGYTKISFISYTKLFLKYT